MKLLAITLLTFLACKGTLLASDPPGNVTVSVTNTQFTAATYSTISCQIITTNAKAKEAMKENATLSKALKEALTSSGSVTEKEIKTSSFDMSQHYAQEQDQFGRPRQNKPDGWDVTHGMIITVCDQSNTGAVLDTIASCRGQITSIGFGSTNFESSMDTARARASIEARKKAEMLAKSQGLKLGKVLNISENSGYQPQPAYASRGAMPETAGSGTEVSPGMLPARATVTITFELKRQGQVGRCGEGCNCGCTCDCTTPLECLKDKKKNGSCIIPPNHKAPEDVKPGEEE